MAGKCLIYSYIFNVDILFSGPKGAFFLSKCGTMSSWTVFWIKLILFIYWDDLWEIMRLYRLTNQLCYTNWGNKGSSLFFFKVIKYQFMFGIFMHFYGYFKIAKFNNQLTFFHMCAPKSFLVYLQSDLFSFFFPSSQSCIHNVHFALWGNEQEHDSAPSARLIYYGTVVWF